MTELQSNPQLALAFEYVQHTRKNIFLTGKAGTGKTTFLHRLKEQPLKRMAVVAPTGVAAINAGGMTIHSLFQLPFGPFLPGNARDADRQRRFSGEKIRLIQSLDLLVIDEISMVRADLLDGIDAVLRRYRDHYQPFGGVQLLMIGDLHQLPPVVKDEEWELLRPHYRTPYFFSSLALQQSAPVAIELKHIYRQSDRIFIDLLNKVRDNRLDQEVLNSLNSRYIADFQPTATEPYITLTAHNAAAQEINNRQLAAVEQPLQRFQAVVSGDFPTQAYPTDEALELKAEAQVMFVKNDINREKRYYNGKIGRITRIADRVIYVRCPGETEDIAVSPVDWQNLKYSLNEQSKEVAEEIIGTFTQYPLRLAWAITIHKSQGLTFERAIIDAQAAFAHGQVYVALSRCKSFDGIVLRSKIIQSSVRTDSTVRDYSAAADRNPPDEAQLEQSKIEFQQALIRELFDFGALKKHIDQLERLFLEHEGSLLPESHEQLKALLANGGTEVLTVAGKFAAHLPAYLAQPGLPEANDGLQERVRKAGVWFAEQLHNQLLPAARNIRIVTDNQAVEKSTRQALGNLQKEIFSKHACFATVQEGFTTQAYLRAKVNAELDFQALQKRQAPVPADAPGKVPHPALFALLKQWRAATAATHDVELYAVLPTKALLELVRVLPVSLPALKKIKGIGAVKSAQFGPALISMIADYCHKHGIETAEMLLPDAEPEPEPEPEKPPKVDTKTVTFNLLRAGKTIDEIAEERGMVRGTIEGHLGHFIAAGELEISEFMDRKAVQEIAQFFTDHNTVSSAEAKAHFGEAYSYGEIKMVLRHLERHGGGE